MKHLRLFIFSLLLSLFLPALAVGTEIEMIAGAGPSTKIVTIFFEEFAKLPAAQGYSFLVPPRSTKHAGGILASGSYVFGRTGRPLNAKEKQQGKEEIFLAKIPITFVVGSKVGIKKITEKQLASIYTGKITNWKSLDGPDAKISLVGREKTEAALSELRRYYPFLDKANYDRILKRDHQVVNFIESYEGDFGLSFGVKPNFKNKYVLNIAELKAGLEVGLVYDTKNRNHPLVSAVKEFVTTPAWQDIVLKNDLLIAD